jgi:hypothetical protein
MDTDGNRRTSAGAPLSRPLARATMGVLLALIVAAAWAWWSAREQRALLALPPTLRSEIYAHNMDDMRALCSSPATPEAFAARCQEQAHFLAEFPECDASCRALIEPYLPKPTR